MELKLKLYDKLCIIITLNEVIEQMGFLKKGKKSDLFNSDAL